MEKSPAGKDVVDALNLNKTKIFSVKRGFIDGWKVKLNDQSNIGNFGLMATGMTYYMYQGFTFSHAGPKIGHQPYMDIEVELVTITTCVSRLLRHGAYGKLLVKKAPRLPVNFS